MMRLWQAVLLALSFAGAVFMHDASAQNNPNVQFIGPTTPQQYTLPASGATVVATSQLSACVNGFVSGTTFTCLNSTSVSYTGGSFATTSGTLVDVTGATVTMTTRAVPVACGFSGSIVASSAVAGAQAAFNLLVDSTPLLGTSGVFFTNPTAVATDYALTLTARTAVLTAASHTFKLQMLSSGGVNNWTVRGIASTPMSLWCAEVG